MRYFIFIFLFSSLLVSGQSKYLIYFKDKGPQYSRQLKKNTPEYREILNSLSQRSVERRIKNLGSDFIFSGDYPVSREYVDALKSMGVEIVWELKWFNAVSAVVPQYLLDNIRGLNFISDIEKVKTFRRRKNDLQIENIDQSLNKSPEDNLYDYGQSASEMEMSDVPAVHNMGISGAGVLIGMIDSGFDWETHPAMQGMDIVAERDFVYGDEDTGNEGDGYHGTETLSLAGAFEEGQLVAPAFDASFIVAKTEDIRSEKRIEEDNFAAAVEWMETYGVDIINTSLGYSEFDPGEESYTYQDMDGNTTLVTRAMEMAFERGVVTVTSAGNEADDPWFYITAPADGENIISVGAVNSSGNVTGFSSRGPTYDGRIKPEILAYGSANYLGFGYSGGYGYKSGTSYASPIVTGICGQLLSVYPHLTNRQLRQIILESGDNTEEPDNIRGYGILSALRAVTFPNLIEIDGIYFVNKIFEAGYSENSSATLLVHKEGNDFIDVIEMNNTDGLIHTALLNGYDENDVLYISFEYSDQSNSINEPTQGAYKYIYGTDFILYNTEYQGNPSNNTPQSYSLEQNFPNPFNPATTITYKLPKASGIKIRIYNVMGELVRTLVNNTVSQGEYSIRWGGVDDKGVKVSSGIYIYTMETQEYFTSKKMILLK